jgi:hypothetical protein
VANWPAIAGAAHKNSATKKRQILEGFMSHSFSNEFAARCPRNRQVWAAGSTARILAVAKSRVKLLLENPLKNLSTSLGRPLKYRQIRKTARSPISFRIRPFMELRRPPEFTSGRQLPVDLDWAAGVSLGVRLHGACKVTWASDAQTCIPLSRKLSLYFPRNFFD